MVLPFFASKTLDVLDADKRSNELFSVYSTLHFSSVGETKYFALSHRRLIKVFYYYYFN